MALPDSIDLTRSQSVAEHALDHLMLPIQSALNDHSVTEIMINGPDQIWLEREGQLSKVTAKLPDLGVTAAIKLLASLSKTDSLEQNGTLEGHWRGWRVTAILSPVSRDSSCICLRRHRSTALDLSEWKIRPSWAVHEAVQSEQSYLSKTHIDSQKIRPHHFEWIMNQAQGVLISGSTGSGKTTFLGSLMAQLPETERVICLEDTPELPTVCSHQLRLVARRGHSVRSLLRLALRLRPDRIVIGEVRGAEAFDMLQAMSTGHAGCMGTIHASSAMGALLRMEQLILTAQLDWPINAIRLQLAEWIRVLVHLSRDVHGRFIREALLVEGVEKGKFIVSKLPILHSTET